MEPRHFFLFFACPFFFSTAQAAKSSTDFEYKNASRRYTISKSVEELAVADVLGKRALKIQACNQKIVDEFWKEITDAVKALQTSKAKIDQEKDAWVKFDGVQFKVLPFEKSRRVFDELSLESKVVFVKSQRACK